MLEKGRMLAIGVVAAGIMGFGAPMAHAATTMFMPHDTNAGLVNANNDQVDGNACDDSVPVNAVGGQLPGDGAAEVYNLGSFGTVNFSNDRTTTNCGIAANQVNSGDDSDNYGGLVNANNDQVNANGCDDTVPVNAVGGQLPENSTAQVFNLFSGLDISGTNSSSTTNCGIAANQVNGTSYHGRYGRYGH